MNLIKQQNRETVLVVNINNIQLVKLLNYLKLFKVPTYKYMV